MDDFFNYTNSKERRSQKMFKLSYYKSDQSHEHNFITDHTESLNTTSRRYSG